jgi:hypothetical protein
MKNQYFGDVNDYRKYGLLRGLSANGEIRTGVCWMLTPSDGRADGQMIACLGKPNAYRNFDSYLFDHLLGAVRGVGERDVRLIENSDVLPGAVFQTELLSDDAQKRRLYFSKMLENFRETHLVFFDPDNGFEVPSRRVGRKDSNKYLYYDEFAKTYSSGHSVLVYQHFVREERSRFIARIANEMMERSGANEIYAFRTSHVVFMLAPQPVHADHFRLQAEHVSRAWLGQIDTQRYPIR